MTSKNKDSIIVEDRDPEYYEINKEEENEKYEKQYFIPTEMDLVIDNNELTTLIHDRPFTGGNRSSGKWPDIRFYTNRQKHPKKGDWRRNVELIVSLCVFDGTKWIKKQFDAKDLSTDDIENLRANSYVKEILLRYKAFGGTLG